MTSALREAGLKDWSDITKALFNDKGAVKNKKAVDAANRGLGEVGFALNDASAEEAREGAAIGSAMQQAEHQMLSAIASGDESKVQMAEIVYQKAQRMFAAFSRIIQSGHELLMELIRKL